ncbi:hypothetical protein [Oryzihumus sp.]
MKRFIIAVAAVALLGGTTTACSGSGSSGSGKQTTVNAADPSAGSGATSGADAAAGADVKLPDSMPLPSGAKVTGTPDVSDALMMVDYTVPAGKAAYDEMLAALPGKGWTVSDKSWSDAMTGGTINASGNGYTLKVLFMDSGFTVDLKKA